MVHYFFLLSVASLLAATVFLGVQMWAARFGLSLWEIEFSEARELHARSMLSLFFGSAIVGFTLQAAPRMLDIPVGISLTLCRFFLLSPILGVSLHLVTGTSWLSNVLVCLPAAGAASILMLRQGRRALRPHSLLLIVSLVTLTIAPFAPVSPDVYLSLLWLGVGAALLATSHIFIGNILGGRRLSPPSLFGVLVVTLLIGLLQLRGWTRVSSGLGFALTVAYAWMTGLHTARNGPSLVRLGLRVGILWMGVAFALSTLGRATPSQTLHLLGLGWGVSVFFSLSIHILSFLSTSRVPTPRSLEALLILWQIVPLSRGILFESPSPAPLVLTALTSTLVLTCWLLSLYRLGRAMRYRKDD